MPDIDNINSTLGCVLRFAIVDGVRLDIEDAQRAQHGTCPLCRSELVAKKGDIRTHHWSHIGGCSQCDDWFQPKGPWHLYWQKKFPQNMQEVLVEKDSVKHFADIKTKSGIVVEVQYSPMSAAEARKRECFYGSMTWVIAMTRDGRHSKFLEEFKNAKKLLSHDDESFCSFGIEMEKIIPSEWVSSNKFVWLDCYGTMLNPESDEDLICIVPKVKDDAFRICAQVNRDKFVSMCFDGSILEFERELRERRDAYNAPHRKREQERQALIQRRKDANKEWEEYRAKDLADQEERKRKLKEGFGEEIFSDEECKKTVNFGNLRYKEELRVRRDFNWNENLITKTVCLEISWIELWALSEGLIFSVSYKGELIKELCRIQLCLKRDYALNDYLKDYELLQLVVPNNALYKLPKYDDLRPYAGRCLRKGLVQPDVIEGRIVFNKLERP